MVLFGLDGWVSIECVWVRLVRLIHIVTGVIWKRVIKGKDVACSSNMLFIEQELKKFTSWFIAPNSLNLS